ncbi:MAG TPA: DegV family protein [Anaerolineales bacterium]
MPRTCILTDSTAYFSKSAFAGQENVTILPHHIQVNGQLVADSKDLSIYSVSSKITPPPLTFPPSVDEFRKAYAALGMRYKDIVVILLSSHLSKASANAQVAGQLCRTPANIFFIDSLSTAIGLGLLVQAAAEYAHRGHSGLQIDHLVRGMVNHIYSVFCLPDLSHLYRAELIDPAQAIVGEMLGVIPFFTLENGRLVHTQKIRSPRHLVDIMFEFIAEFENLKYLALLQGITTFEQESRNLRDRISQNVRTTPLCEHSLSLALATILGPHSMGLVAMENAPKEA